MVCGGGAIRGRFASQDEPWIITHAGAYQGMM
jgi:hypothetical protein